MTHEHQNTAEPSSRSRVTSLFSFSALLLTLLLALPFFLATTAEPTSPILRDPDLWWHLRNAGQLLSTHHFIRADMYSFTVCGKAWINPEWLAEVPYYAAFRIFGERGILLVMLSAIETILIGIFTLCYLRCRNFMAAYLSALLLMVLGSINFGPRTLLFGWACFTAEMILLELFQQRKDFLWLLPPLFALWINLHGSWMIGLVFFFAYAGSGLFEGSWGGIYTTRWQPAQRKKLFAAGAASVLALFLNPYGWRMVLYPFDLAFHQKLNVSVGEEWRSINFHLGSGKFLFVTLCVLLIFALWKQIRLPLYQVLFALLAIYSGFTYVRFLFLIGISLCPIVGVWLVDMFPTRRVDAKNRTLLNAALIAIICTISWLRLPSAAMLREGRDRAFPPQAFLRLGTLDPNRRIFNAYGYGGYMEWKARDHPTFVDSRTDIFEHYGVFADYLRAINLDDTVGILDKYHIEYVFFPNNDPLVYLLRHSPGWGVNYDDGTAVILERVREH